MACTASTLLASAASGGFTNLDNRTVLLGIIGSLAPAVGSPTAATTMASATTAGFEKADDEELYAALAQFLCSKTSCNIDTTLTTAASNGLFFLQTEQVMQCILQVVSNGVGTLTTVLNTAITLGYNSLQDRELVVSIVQLTVNNTTPFATLLSNASTNGFFKLERFVLIVLILQLFCSAAVVIAPGVPTALDISIASANGSTILTWTNPDVPTTNEVWRSKNGGAYALLTSVGGGVHTATDTDVLPANDYWSYKVRACNGASCSAFSNLADANNGYNPVADASVTLSFPTLIVAYGQISISGFVNLTTISMPKLKRVSNAQFSIGNCANLTTLTLTSLEKLFGFALSQPNNIATLAFPVLTEVESGFLIPNNPTVTDLQIPVLATVGAAFSPDALGITTFSAPSLVSVGALLGGSVHCSNLNMTSMSWPVLATVAEDFIIDTSVSLQDVSFPNYIMTNGANISFQNCALTDVSVNEILARGVASGVTICVFDTSGGTSMAPSGQGVNDKATLIGLGNSVTTN